MDDTNAYMKALYGQHAIHIPLNLIVQAMDGTGTVTGVFQTKSGVPLLFGSKKTHQLVIADVILRPQLVTESNDFQGRGLSSLARDGFADVDTWIKGGVILSPK